MIRKSSSTIKLWVLFNASANSSYDILLNGKLLIGPNLKQNLLAMILRFMGHVMTADITMMCRQILVAETDRVLQLILWRESLEEPQEIFSLNTMTYGTSPAPFLTMRCLRRLAEGDTKDFPLATRAVSNKFFMNESLSGSDSIDEAIELCKQSLQLLLQGGFPLREWRSNDLRVLTHLSQ